MDYLAMDYLDNLAIGLLLSGLIGLLAYRRGSLAPSGALGALIVGTLVFGLGGWAWGLTLVTFFVSSSALSHYKEAAKERLAEKFAKGHRRDLAQTLANGGAGSLLAVAGALSGEPIFFAAFLGAMAAVNADTWATELGVLDATPPRLITTGEVVEIGTSGGVSRVGLLASAAGALVIGLSALIFTALIYALDSSATLKPSAWMILASLLGGTIGSLFDSLLGASLQAIYYCPACAKTTERPVHRCGTVARHRRGWRWLDNDIVNLLSSLVGAAAAAAFYWL